MKNLELAQELRSKCGISGEGLPVSVAGQTGELKRIVNWIAEAYESVQSLHSNWDFMLADFSFPTIVGTSNYTLSAISQTEHAGWKVDTFRCYLTATGTSDEQWLIFRPWDEFRDQFMMGPVRDVAGRPVYFTIKPDKSVQLWPKPDAVYTVSGEHWLRPQVFADGDAEPRFPQQFHRILVYQGMMYYGAFEGAPEVYADGQNEYNKVLTRLELDQLPAIEIAGAMA